MVRVVRHRRPRDARREAGLRSEVGARIRTLREGRGMTQGELGAPDVTKAAISAIEGGKVFPSLWLVYRLAERLNVSPRELLPLP